VAGEQPAQSYRSLSLSQSIPQWGAIHKCDPPPGCCTRKKCVRLFIGSACSRRIRSTMDRSLLPRRPTNRQRRPQRPHRHNPPLPRRPHLRAGRCGVRPHAHDKRRRLQQRVIDGTFAGRDGNDGTGAELSGDSLSALTHAKRSDHWHSVFSPNAE
jgi:hypothetical protein